MEVIEQSFIVMSLVLLGLIVLTMLLVSPLYLNHRRKKRMERPYVVGGALLTPPEQTLFNALQEAAAGRWWVFPKVSLEDIVQARHDDDRSLYQSARSHISSRHADFILCDPVSFRCLAAIQLDPFSPDHPGKRQRDISLDGVFARSGLPLIHIAARDPYDTAALRADIEAALAAAAAAPAVS